MNNKAEPVLDAKEKPRTERGAGTIRQRGSRWVIAYYDTQGRRRWETHSTEAKAKKALQTKLALKEAGKLDPVESRATIEALAKLYLADKKGTAPKSYWWLELVWDKHLKPFFGGFQAGRITTEKMIAYRNERLDAQASPTTVNKELTVLRAIYYHALNDYTPPKIARVPKFPAKLTEPPPRTGFLNDEQYDALQAVCKHQWLRALLAICYHYGFRKGEMIGKRRIGLKVNQVDLKERTIRLNVGETKNNAGRVVKMTPDVYDFLRVCVDGKAPDDPVFTWENGRPVKDFRGAWAQMIKDAKVPSFRFHDLRRSAGRNLLRAGVNRDLAMRITGHKTDSMYSRYNIVVENDFVEAAEKIAQRRATVANGVQPAQAPEERLQNGDKSS